MRSNIEPVHYTIFCVFSQFIEDAFYSLRKYEILFVFRVFRNPCGVEKAKSILVVINMIGSIAFFREVMDFLRLFTCFLVTIQSSQTSTKLKTKFHCKKTVILSIYKHQ